MIMYIVDRNTRDPVGTSNFRKPGRRACYFKRVVENIVTTTTTIILYM